MHARQQQQQQHHAFYQRPQQHAHGQQAPVLQHPKPQHPPVQMPISPSPPPGGVGGPPPPQQRGAPPHYGPAPTAQPAGAPFAPAQFAAQAGPLGPGFGEYQYQAQLGMQLGTAAMAMGSEYVEKNINRYVNLPALKHYFNVNNSYVIRKVGLLLFPWRHQSWARAVVRSELDGRVEAYKPPREDINSPDLYVPVMALVTYVLLVGIAFGQKSKFTPEVLGGAASTALAIMFFEVLLLKLGCYLLNISTEVQLLDLIAYSGYKFVGAIFTRVSHLIFPTAWGLWIAFAWSSLTIFFFLLRSLRYVILSELTTPSAVGAGKSMTPIRKRRIHFLFVMAALQVCSMFLLVL